MTAKELHASVPVEPEYKGGFTTERGVELAIGGDDVGVHLHQHFGRGGGSTSTYARLSASEAFELAGALVAAAQATDNLERENR